MLGEEEEDVAMTRHQEAGMLMATAALQEASQDKLEMIQQYCINVLLTLTLHPTTATVQSHSVSFIICSFRAVLPKLAYCVDPFIERDIKQVSLTSSFIS